MIEFGVRKVRRMQRISSSQVEAGDFAVFQGKYVGMQPEDEWRAIKINSIGKPILVKDEERELYLVHLVSGRSVVGGFPSAFEYYREEKQ